MVYDISLMPGNFALWFGVHNSDIIGAIAGSAVRPDDATVIYRRSHGAGEVRLAQVLGDQVFTVVSPSVLVVSTDSKYNRLLFHMLGVPSQPLMGDVAIKMVTAQATTFFVLDPGV